MSRFDALEKKVKYKFNNQKLLITAMTHSSYANEHKREKISNNERLEFLGDAVLELITSEFLYGKYKEKPEGELTKFRASIVCEPTLAYCAADIALGGFLLLGKGEEATGGRNRSSLVSDAMEALIGAIYLDGGLASAKEFVHNYILSDLDNKKLFFDSKTILQEMIQGKYDEPLIYELLKEEGPDHDKIFTAKASIGSLILGVGEGHSKKNAEQVAAYKGILFLKNKGEQEK